MLLNKDLEKVLKITTSLSNEHNYAKLLMEILEDGMDISNADGGTLYLLNDNKLDFYFMITNIIFCRHII